jgi:hypothetical protein
LVDAVTAISGSAATSQVQVDRSLSITSEPDNKWTAARQSRIDDDQVALRQANAGLQSDIARFGGVADGEMEVLPDGHSSSQEGHHSPDHQPVYQDEATLSGESELIGTVDFDDDTPFGHRTAIV